MDKSIIDSDYLKRLAVSDEVLDQKHSECLASGEELRKLLNVFKDSHPAAVEELLDIRISRAENGMIVGYYNHRSPRGISDYLNIPDHGLRNKVDERVSRDVDECTKTR